MEITFAGAAREVTGSCHLLRVNGQTIALDCGLFQGRRAEANVKNRELPVSVDELDAVILSHAHIDHAGRLPFLTKAGFRRTIWATPATRDLSAIMLMDSAHIQEKDAEHLTRHGKECIEPLYAQRDVAQVIGQMNAVPYERSFTVASGVDAMFYDAGHILGSASVVLHVTEGSRSWRVVFSGDIGRRGLAIIRDPHPPVGADVVIMESTYGNRDHASVDGARERLGTIVRETAARGGRILIPAFAVGRTQELVYDLHSLARSGGIPRIPVYIDSPLATDVTGVFEQHPDTFDLTEDLIQQVRALFHFDLVHYTRDVSESKALNTMNGPMVVIAASGMAESGRILHHLIHGASDPRNTILIVGFQAEHTLGRRIVERRSVIRVLGEEIPLRAQVEVLNGYSAHADRQALLEWARTVRGDAAAPPVYLVHGEAEAQDAFAVTLRDDGYPVTVPQRGDRVTL